MEQIRIQKYIADCGLMSRRKAEEEIARGNVTVNGRKAEIGQKITPGKDYIAVNGKTVVSGAKKYYLKLNKPRGYVSTMSDEKGRKCVADLVKNVPERVYPIGRLDLDSEGLLLMTNDGALANALMHPKTEVEKVYVVKVRSVPSDEQMRALNQSMEIDGYQIKPCRVSCPEPTIPNKLRFILTEGRNRQIRKMCENVGLEVTRLKRIAEGKVQLGSLRSGTWEELEGKELSALLALKEI
ncbi:MAG: rRNA pseudouridine synthase [Clostridia bacterium]|nr:rRNA pseudouridine synthase [Clostridia bacterium]